MKIIVYLWIERALYDTHLYNMYGLVLGGVYNTVEADGPATELNTRYSGRHRTARVSSGCCYTGTPRQLTSIWLAVRMARKAVNTEPDVFIRARDSPPTRVSHGADGQGRVGTPW